MKFVFSIGNSKAQRCLANRTKSELYKDMSKNAQQLRTVNML